jgi:hypothetical protein
MYQIQDSMPFHPHQRETNAKAIGHVSFLSFKWEQTTKNENLVESVLIQSRGNRVEELEKRLKWMEGQLKRAVEDRQFEPDAEPRNEPRGLETPNSDQPQAGTSYLTPNIQGGDPLDPAFTIAGESPQALGFGVPSQKSNCKSAT